MELGEVCSLIVDCEHNTAPTQEAGYPSIRTPNIGRGFFILDGVNRVSEETYRQWTRRAVPKPGDLIMAREAPVGNVAMIPPGLTPCLGQRTLLIRCDKSKADSAFISYLLNGPQIQATIYGMTNGATVPHLNMKDVRTLPVPPLPALSTQKKIAVILSAYDDLVENNRRRIKILEAMAQNLYREWFGKFRFPGHQHSPLTSSAFSLVPVGWEQVPLGQLAAQVRDSVDPGSIAPETPYFGLEHLPRKSITLSDWGCADEVQSTKLLFKKGDILFGKIRPYFHKVGVAPLEGVCSSDAIVIRPRSQDWFGLILGCTSSSEFIDHATATSQGTKMPRANWDVLAKYPVHMPPQSILNEFNEFITGIVDEIHNLVFSNKVVHHTRDLLLPKLISGEVDVSDLDIAVPDEASA